MDPLTTAISSALLTVMAEGVADVAKKSIIDGYEGLKALLKKKFGGASEIVGAIERLECKPDSAGRQMIVAEELTNAKAATDPEILAAAQALLARIKATPDGAQHIQKVTGNYNAVVQGSGTASVTISGTTANKNV